MTHKEFDEVVTQLLANTNKTLLKKEKEYSLEEDRLSTFKRAASLQQQTSAQALLGMMTKHIISIYSFVEEKQKISEAMAKEKIGDAINYLCLLYAVLKEEGFKTEEE